MKTCPHCGRGHRRRKTYCTDACMHRAWRRRRAGLPEDAHSGAEGGRRGRVALGELTRGEQFDAMLRELAAAERTLTGDG